jgi:AP-3 complex subunit sigma
MAASVLIPCKVHHILSEIVQGGIVLETNVEEIDESGTFAPCDSRSENCLTNRHLLAHQAAKLRKESFASSNPLSLGVGSGARGSNLKTPLGWLTGKLTGVGAR